MNKQGGGCRLCTGFQAFRQCYFGYRERSGCANKYRLDGFLDCWGLDPATYTLTARPLVGTHRGVQEQSIGDVIRDLDFQLINRFFFLSGECRTYSYLNPCLKKTH